MADKGLLSLLHQFLLKTKTSAVEMAGDINKNNSREKTNPNDQYIYIINPRNCKLNQITLKSPMFPENNLYKMIDTLNTWNVSSFTTLPNNSQYQSQASNYRPLQRIVTKVFVIVLLS